MMDFQEFKRKHQKVPVEELFPRIRSAPLVSVLIQTFNHSDYISDCLDGVLSQKTDFPFEIILGEDSSTDGTRDICIRYAQKYQDRIRLFFHRPENKIRVQKIKTGNFNATYNFYTAEGNYLAFCEGDDVWSDSLKLQKQVDFLRTNPEFVMSFHGYREVHDKDQSVPDQGLLDQCEQDLSKSDLQKILFHPLISTVCCRKIFQELPEEILNVINLDSFLLSLLGNYGRGKYQENISPNIYRRHSGGIWTGKQKTFRFRSKIITYRNLSIFYRKQHAKSLASFFMTQEKKIEKQLLRYYLRHGNFYKILIFLRRSFLNIQF